MEKSSEGHKKNIEKHEPLDVIGRHQTRPAIQGLTTKEAVGIHLTLHQHHISRCQRQLQLRVVIGRVSERQILEQSSEDTTMRSLTETEQELVVGGRQQQLVGRGRAQPVRVVNLLQAGTRGHGRHGP